MPTAARDTNGATRRRRRSATSAAVIQEEIDDPRVGPQWWPDSKPQGPDTRKVPARAR